MMGDTLQSGQPFREACDALAGDVTDGRARSIHCRSSARPLRDDGAVRPVRHQPQDRLQVGGPLRARGRAGLVERSHAQHRRYCARQLGVPAPSRPRRQRLHPRSPRSSSSNTSATTSRTSPRSRSPRGTTPRRSPNSAGVTSCCPIRCTAHGSGTPTAEAEGEGVSVTASTSRRW